jgi:hypothetical protein
VAITPSARYSRETFKRTYGPTYYAFEYGGVLFLMVDNVNYIGFDPAKPHGRGKYEGRIDQRQLDFFANVLKEYPTDKLVVTCMHIPLQNYLFSDDPSMNTINSRDFLKLISDRPNTVSLSGHTHTTEHHYFGAEDGFVGPSLHHHHVMTAVSGSWWSGPYDHRGIAVADSRDGSPNVMAAARNTDRYPVTRHNQAITEFDPIALRIADAKRPTTHTFPGGHGELPVDSPFASDHGDPGAAAQRLIRRRIRPIPALNTGLCIDRTARSVVAVQSDPHDF